MDEQYGSLTNTRGDTPYAAHHTHNGNPEDDMNERCCQNCVYATGPQGRWHRVMMGRFPGLRVCFNHPETPGQMQEVRVDGLCKNYRARSWPRGRRERPPKPRNDDIRYIPLTHGLYATVDAQDYHWLSKYKWAALFNPRSNIIYAARSVAYDENGKRRRRTILMHREIMKPPKGMVIDHINSNGINNRRRNLRTCTPAQNVQNARPRTHGKSRFIGVFPNRGKWQAAITVNKEKFYLGLFEDEVEAAKARDRKAIELCGQFARLNFPDEFGGHAHVTPPKGPPPPRVISTKSEARTEKSRSERKPPPHLGRADG